jgi:hypothetical protein
MIWEVVVSFSALRGCTLFCPFLSLRRLRLPYSLKPQSRCHGAKNLQRLRSLHTTTLPYHSQYGNHPRRCRLHEQVSKIRCRAAIGCYNQHTSTTSQYPTPQTISHSPRLRSPATMRRICRVRRYFTSPIASASCSDGHCRRSSLAKLCDWY